MDRATDTPILNFKLDGKQIKITHARAIIGNATYAISNISSVSLTKEKRRKSNFFQNLLVVVGVVAVIFGIAVPDYALTAIPVGVILGVAGVLFRNKAPYTIQIGSSSGDHPILMSTNKKKIKKIIEAINVAIIRRG